MTAGTVLQKRSYVSVNEQKQIVRLVYEDIDADDACSAYIAVSPEYVELGQFDIEVWPDLNAIDIIRIPLKRVELEIAAKELVKLAKEIKQTEVIADFIYRFVKLFNSVRERKKIPFDSFYKLIVSHQP